MNQKIVFFDIDGTIYSFKKGMPKDTKEAIKQLKKNGHIPVICTGRTRSMIYPEHLAPGFEHIIAGAGTYVEIEGKQTHLVEMEQKEAKKLIQKFIGYGFFPVAEGRDALYLGTDVTKLGSDNKEVVRIYQEKIGTRVLTVNHPDLRVSKVSALFTHDSDKEGMIQSVEKDYTVVDHNGNLLELIPKGTSKVKGIEIMIEQLDIPRENTYAFGDSFNDIDMLQYVQYGCAMGNSEEAIKKQTPFVTDDYDKGGIMNGLKKFGLI